MTDAIITPVKIIKKLELPEVPNPHFHPSPTMRVHFPNGSVVQMNRRERRQRGFYGQKVRKADAIQQHR